MTHLMTRFQTDKVTLLKWVASIIQILGYGATA